MSDQLRLCDILHITVNPYPSVDFALDLPKTRTIAETFEQQSEEERSSQLQQSILDSKIRQKNTTRIKCRLCGKRLLSQGHHLATHGLTYQYDQRKFFSSRNWHLSREEKRKSITRPAFDFVYVGSDNWLIHRMTTNRCRVIDPAKNSTLGLVVIEFADGMQGVTHAGNVRR